MRVAEGQSDICVHIVSPLVWVKRGKIIAFFCVCQKHTQYFLRGYAIQDLNALAWLWCCCYTTRSCCESHLNLITLCFRNSLKKIKLKKRESWAHDVLNKKKRWQFFSWWVDVFFSLAGFCRDYFSVRNEILTGRELVRYKKVAVILESVCFMMTFASLVGFIPCGSVSLICCWEKIFKLKLL